MLSSTAPDCFFFAQDCPRCLQIEGPAECHEVLIPDSFTGHETPPKCPRQTAMASPNGFPQTSSPPTGKSFFWVIRRLTRQYIIADEIPMSLTGNGDQMATEASLGVRRPGLRPLNTLSSRAPGGHQISSELTQRSYDCVDLLIRKKILLQTLLRGTGRLHIYISSSPHIWLGNFHCVDLLFSEYCYHIMW